MINMLLLLIYLLQLQFLNTAFVDDDIDDFNLYITKENHDYELIENTQSSDQQYIKRINYDNLALINKYKIDYYFIKVSSLVISLYQAYQFKEKPVKIEGTRRYEYYSTTNITPTQKFEETNFLLKIPPYLYLLSEIAPIIIDLYYNDITILGESIKISLLSCNAGINYYASYNKTNKTDYKYDLLALSLGLINIWIINKIQTNKRPDIFLLQNIKLKSNWPNE